MRHLLPEGWKRPSGYSNGIEVAAGRTIYVAGLIGWNDQEQFESDCLIEQFRSTLINTLAVLKEANAGPEHIVRMTWYIKNKQEYLQNLKEIGQAYREVIGKNYPVMACLEVADLMEDRAKIEIETTAVVPD
jgi:enamine deaminase RidA (YjgF/YER057c/UK114 family)